VACTGDNQCCTGHCETGTCCSGVESAGAPTGTRVPDAGGAATACGDGFCCGGLECCMDGYPPRCTQKNGTACTSDIDCCQVGANGAGANGGCHNGTCCLTASPYSRCTDDSDCCAPSTCVPQNGGPGPAVCCWAKGTTCTDFGCSTCCNPPPTPPVGQTGTCL
jgi:hypothetical protein